MKLSGVDSFRNPELISTVESVTGQPLLKLRLNRCVGKGYKNNLLTNIAKLTGPTGLL
jgi:hypothetical protein